MKKNKAILLSVVFIFIISSCSTFSFYRVPVTQGNLYDEEDLNKLEIGQTKEQVKFILGTPMIKDAFNSSRWDYVSLITVGENKIVDKKLIVLFNDNNLLESWELVDQS